ncbi:hypothetical protein ACFQ3R_13125 [Mesonia ostreae]|uniref:Uncharacterized protein n=1 Tax=Mesonia ostreae TaxID=861110 RepID=A0ABU2KFN8_9FLAO|nr:hypothetical protein [Mesonia ostreae]MDT0293527.1 hypothetical protein [Mesonia ostreae]
MEQKIYISLKESENLVFNKLIIIPKSRFQISRAQKDWSIALFVIEENLIEHNERLFITSGSVIKYEIPEKEENLFINHFRVPKGLLVIAKREVRDSQNIEDKINFPDEAGFSPEINLFKGFRRGLVQNYSLIINDNLSKEFSEEVFAVINNLEALSEFKVNFIKEIISQGFYPIKERNDGNFYTEAVKRFNWLGAFIFKEFPRIKEVSEEDLKNAKQWLLNLKDKEDSKTILKSIANVPDIFFEEFEFIIGYYVAASFFEETNTGENYFLEIKNYLKKLKLEKNYKALFWSIFFKAIFKEEVDFLYLIPSIQNQQRRIECKLIELLFDGLSVSCKNAENISISKRQAVAEYLQLQNGGALIEPIFITKNDKKNLLENNFSNKRLLNIGIEIKNDSSFKHLFHNSCLSGNSNFTLNLTVKPSEATFYINDTSEVKDWLKGLKIKTKPLSKIIDNNKKALVGFLIPESYERSLFKFYEWILNNAVKSILFKTIVFVLLVDEEVEYIQSPEFQNKKIEMERFCKAKFGDNTTVLVKNESVSSDGEIKRNLKHLLEHYNIKDIELINENIDDRIHNWVLSVNNEYLVESEINDFYTVLNK